MAKATPPKTKRNKRLVELKKSMSFRSLGRVFHISGARAKAIYDKEIRKGKGVDRASG